LSYKEVIAKFEEKMNVVLEVEKKEFSGIRTGRANPSLLDRIHADYYGTPTPLPQMASISTPDPRSLMVTPWDKGMLSKIEKAILASDLGLNPTNDGNVIRMSLPHLTEERRKDLVKMIKKIAEDMRIAVRNVRRDAVDAVKKLEKDGTITEDDLKRAQDDIQKTTDKHIADIDRQLAAKELEIMQV
jgi:ribosome recycling factor